MTTGHRLLYFLGAGAARACGYQTTPELYHSLMGERAGLALIQKFGTSLNAVTEGKPIDIETLYTLVAFDVREAANGLYDQGSGSLANSFVLDVLRRFEPWHGRVEDLKAAFEEAKNAILDFIAEMFWRVRPDTEPYKRLFLPDACRQLGMENVTVFTTNYDTSLESTLSDYVPFTAGLVGDWFDPSELAARRGDRLRIVKLHGSLDLYQTKDGRIARINAPMKPGRWYGGHEILGPFLVPPEEGKVSYEDSYEQLLRILELEVKEANALAIIGSSLRDTRLAGILSEVERECQVLIACGSSTSPLREKWFSHQPAVLEVRDYFPNAQIEEWLRLQIHMKGKWPND